MGRKKVVTASQSKNVKRAIMAAILVEIEVATKAKKKLKNAGRASCYGVMSEVIKRHKAANPWLNRDVLNNYKRMIARKKVIRIDADGSSISSLTGIGVEEEADVSAIENSGDDGNCNDMEGDSGPSTNTSDLEVISRLADETAIMEVNRGGRPKGTTNAQIIETNRSQKVAMNYAASKAALMKESFSNSGYDRLPKGTYKDIISETESKFSLSEGSLNIKTLLTRVKRGKLTCSGRGRVSPMIALEAHFLDALLQLAAMRQPVTTKQALQLINSMVTTTNLKQSIIAWKKTNLPGSFEDEKAQYLGPKYWKNFKKRHPELKQRRAVRFDSNREDWCTKDNFEKMYSHIYPAMVQSGVAIELDEEVMVTAEGNITDVQTKSWGRKTKYLLTRPELLMFVDEVGSNTSQKKDGNIGGQTFIVHKTQRALLRSSHADCHFTVLGFTNALGEPICCVIIIAGKEIAAKHRMGLQPWADFVGDPEVDLNENSNGVDKYYPYGPTCYPFGKEVETYVTCSESGSITSEILVESLAHIDRKLTFDRSEAVPFLLLDGHGSRFLLPFLDYIGAPATKWTVCIGVPYGTHIWQVGDSSEQNGAFKQALTERKQEILQKKNRHANRVS
jgi:hypothetical protein